MLAVTLDRTKGIRKIGTRVQLTPAGVANALSIYQVDNLATQVGTRSFKLVRLWGWNNAGANSELHIGNGVGAGFVDLIPPIITLAGLNFDVGEWELPEIVSVAQDLTAYASVATVEVVAEVEVLF